jgi:hypothetical protein
MAKSVKKSAPAQAPAQQHGGGLPNEGENIDKIRDILFGSQSRQIEKKLMAMDDRLDKEIAALRSETKTTLDTLEQFVRKELQSLADQLSTEKSERTESAENLSEKIDDAKKNLEKKLSLQGDKMIKDQRDIQDQILQQSKNIMDEIHQKNDALQLSLDRAVESLSSDKADRLALANLMMEAAMRLKDEFQLPETE